MKLADVLASVAPQLAHQMDTARSSKPVFTGELSQYERKVPRKQQHAKKALVLYATLVAEHYDHEITDQALSEIQQLAEQHCAGFGTVEERRKAFEAIAAYVLDQFGLERDATVVAQYRLTALQAAGMDAFGKVMQVPVADDISSLVPQEEWFLDSEFIAIYW